jgi:hypothetical protein
MSGCISGLRVVQTPRSVLAIVQHPDDANLCRLGELIEDAIREPSHPGTTQVAEALDHGARAGKRREAFDDSAERSTKASASSALTSA